MTTWKQRILRPLQYKYQTYKDLHNLVTFFCSCVLRYSTFLSQTFNFLLLRFQSSWVLLNFNFKVYFFFFLLFINFKECMDGSQLVFKFNSWVLFLFLKRSFLFHKIIRLAPLCSVSIMLCLVIPFGSCIGSV